MNEGGEVSLSITTLVVMVQAILLILKISGAVSWSWIVIFSPMWFTLLIFGIIVVLFVMFAPKGDSDDD